MKVLAVLALAAVANAAFTTKLSIKQCTQQGCKTVEKRVALDATSNGTESLIAASGNALTLTYGGAAVGGPRVYLIEDEGTNANYMFMLKNQEFTFDVELSSLPCGFNAALYFVGMTENKGGAESGTNYCDAQAVDGVFCSEMDVLEANTVAQQYTTHACVDTCGSFSDAPECKGNGSPSTVCDQSGCGMNPFRYGAGTTYDNEASNELFHGPGSTYAIDTTKAFTTTTQFHAEGGQLSNISRFYLQGGKRVDLPTLYVLPPTDGQHYGAFEQPAITSDFCTDIYDRWNGNGAYAPLAQMGKNMESGMVLAMSAWYAQETYNNGVPDGTQTGMSWLDGLNKWTNDHMTKVGPCHESTSDTGSPGQFRATFSNIRVGDIGTTTDGSGPSPTPPTPTPPAPPTPPTPPTPTPPTPPAPSGCPGGSLSACLALCPSTPPAAYQACVGECSTRCAPEVQPL